MLSAFTLFPYTPLFRSRSAPRPDIVFTRAKLAVFIDGCFWHGCPEHGVSPRTNIDYWSAKIARNRQRDHRSEEHTSELQSRLHLVCRLLLEKKKYYGSI